MQKILLLIFTLMLSGRAMTLAFIHRAGGAQAGDPPIAWLMPLIGDALIGLSGLAIALLIVRATGMWVWTAIISWNIVGVWDAMSAFIISSTNPWPEFFMLQTFGSSMFFMASAMHLANIYLAAREPLKSHFLADEAIALAGQTAR